MAEFVNFGTPIHFGWGCFDRIAELIPMGRSFIVSGRKSARNLGLINRLEELNDVEIGHFSGVEPNPSSVTVEEGASEMADFNPDIVIAVGGGSVMDAAKFMSVIAKHGGSVMDYIRGREPPDGGYPLYAVPTTPGTSSEITPYSIVTLEEINNKVGLRHPSIYPKGAVIDPKLTVTLPEDQTAATGLDILSHAVESYWASGSDPLTREMSLNSVTLVKEHLVKAYRDGSVRKNREGVSLASVFAGLAFSNTGTTICHSISYPVTYDTGLPHGIAVAITLGPTFDLLHSRNVQGLDRLAEAFGSDTFSFSDDMLDLLSALKVPKTFPEAGFEGGLQRIMSTDLTPLMKNMPIGLSEADMESIVKSVL